MFLLLNLQLSTHHHSVCAFLSWSLSVLTFRRKAGSIKTQLRGRLRSCLLCLLFFVWDDDEEINTQSLSIFLDAPAGAGADKLPPPPHSDWTGGMNADCALFPDEDKSQMYLCVSFFIFYFFLCVLLLRLVYSNTLCEQVVCFFWEPPWAFSEKMCA